ncbi:MAG: MarR family transcriptional regulator [Sulfobacillus thermotolerans]|nr:MarR family transcriptional regulator [Sulfobacillus thermotolerans]
MSDSDVLEELVMEVERFVRLGWRWRAKNDTPVLNGAEIRALMILYRHHAISASALADKMGVGRPATSSVLRRLRDLGYVGQEPDPQDRRRHFLTVTALGRSMVESVRTARRAMWQQHLKALSPDDQQQLLGLLKKVSDSRKEFSQDERR